MPDSPIILSSDSDPPNKAVFPIFKKRKRTKKKKKKSSTPDLEPDRLPSYQSTPTRSRSSSSLSSSAAPPKPKKAKRRWSNDSPRAVSSPDTVCRLSSATNRATSASNFERSRSCSSKHLSPRLSSSVFEPHVKQRLLSPPRAISSPDTPLASTLSANSRDSFDDFVPTRKTQQSQTAGLCDCPPLLGNVASASISIIPHPIHFAQGLREDYIGPRFTCSISIYHEPIDDSNRRRPPSPNQKTPDISDEEEEEEIKDEQYSEEEKEEDREETQDQGDADDEFSDDEEGDKTGRDSGKREDISDVGQDFDKKEKEDCSGGEDGRKLDNEEKVVGSDADDQESDEKEDGSDEEEDEEEEEDGSDEEDERDLDDEEEEEDGSGNEKDVRDLDDEEEKDKSSDGEEEDSSDNDEDERDFDDEEEEEDSSDDKEEEDSSDDEDDRDLDDEENEDSSDDDKDERDLDEKENDDSSSDDEDESDLDEEEESSNDGDNVQYGAGRLVPPPRVDQFIPNMVFPTDDELAFLHENVDWEDAGSVRINNRLVRMRENQIVLQHLDQIPNLVAHVQRIFDIFIRRMVQRVGGSLESTVYWLRLRYHGENVEEFHLNHRTYATGTGHHLMNDLAIHLQSAKQMLIDHSKLELAMFIFKKSGQGDLAGRGGGVTLNSKIKRILRLNRQFVLTDGYCLPVSIAIGIADSDSKNVNKSAAERSAAKSLLRKLTRNDRSSKTTKDAQLVEAKKVLKQSGLDMNNDTHTSTHLVEIAKYYPEYQFAVWYFDEHNQNVTIHTHLNQTAKGFVGLYFEKGHYEFFRPHTGKDSLLTTFCHKCSKLVHHKSGTVNRHAGSCKAKCKKCGFTTCERGDGNISKCDDCGVTFFSQNCFSNHLKKRNSKALPHCKTYVYCQRCCSSVRSPEYAGVEHKCGTQFCRICRKSCRKSHNCSYAPPSSTERRKALKKQEKWRLFVFDFETIVSSDSTVPTFPQDGPQHVPNLICGQFVCFECVDSDGCIYCGPPIIFSYKREAQKGPVLSQFVKFLQTDTRLANAILVAHNGGKYDHSFVLSELASAEGITPNLLLNGNKVVQAEIEVKNIGQITFKDSINFIPMGLSRMPEAFGFVHVSKGVFPYLYNHPDHYGTVLPSLPDVSYYQPEFLTPPAKKAFMEWYSKHQNTPFDFDAEIEKYCLDDVLILATAIKKYIKICGNIFNGWNPLVHCSTIASFVLFVMKFEHFQNDEIGYIPERGFPGRNNSVFALKYLEFIDSEDESLRIQHSLNYGEKKIVCGPRWYRVDGYSEQHKTIFEVYGCLYHGCRQCFTARTEKCPHNPQFTFEDLYQNTMSRQRDLENAGYKIVAKWECEIKQELLKNPKMKAFFTECRHMNHLMPRKAMFGGRTQPFQAFAASDKQYEIVYYDFCSLYPFVNMKAACYPKGQPKVIRANFAQIVPNTSLPYRGLVFCDVLPPADLAIPVLPMSIRQKLIFTLCRTCAERNKDPPCPHSSVKKRYLTGCWYSEELNEAVSVGYKLLRYHEVWHWEDWFVGGFFERFLAPLLKIKHEASGWPRQNMTDIEKKAHVETIKRNDGVAIEIEKVAKNPALRQMAKLFLNSAWGKFAQNPIKTETKLLEISNGDGVFSFFNSVQHEPVCLELWGSKHILVGRKPLRDAVKSARYTNVVYGVITTSVARLCLYEAMTRVGAKNLLYCDTDSVIFRQKRGQNLLGDLCGDGLGKMVNETPKGLEIKEVVCISPKVYALKYENEKGEESYSVKAKGFTLNCLTSQSVSFESMKKMMLQHLEKQAYEPLEGKKYSFTRGIKRPLDAPETKLVSKKLKPVADKGTTTAQGFHEPFGIRDNLNLVENYPF